MKFYAINENFSDEVEAISLLEAIWKLSINNAHCLPPEQLKAVKIYDESDRLLAQTDIEPVNYDVFHRLSQLGIINDACPISFNSSIDLWRQLQKFENVKKVLEDEKIALSEQYERKKAELENRIGEIAFRLDCLIAEGRTLSKFASEAWLYSLTDCACSITAPVKDVKIDEIYICSDLLNGDEVCKTTWRHSKTFGTSLASRLDIAFSHPVEVQCWRFESTREDKVYLKIGSGLIEYAFPAGFAFKTYGKSLLPVAATDKNGPDFVTFLQGMFDRSQIFKGQIKVNFFQNKFAPLVRFFSYVYDGLPFQQLPIVEDSAIQKSRAFDLAFNKIGRVFGKAQSGLLLFQEEGKSQKVERFSFSKPIAIDLISKDDLISLAFSPRMQMNGADKHFKLLAELIRIKIKEADASKGAITRLIELFGCKNNLAIILLIEREVDLFKTRLINLGRLFPRQDFIPTEEQLDQIARRCRARLEINNKEKTEKQRQEGKKRVRVKTESKRMKKSQKEVKKEKQND